MERYLKGMLSALQQRRGHAELRQRLIREGVTTEQKLMAYAMGKGIDPSFLLQRVTEGKEFSEGFDDLDYAYDYHVLAGIATVPCLAYLLRVALGREPYPDDPDVETLVTFVKTYMEDI